MVLQQDDASLEGSLTNAIDELFNEIDLLHAAMVTGGGESECFYDFQSRTRVTYQGQLEDVDKLKEEANRGEDVRQYAGIADVGLVLDTSITDPDEVLYMRQVASALALELDIWSIETTDTGARRK